MSTLIKWIIPISFKFFFFFYIYIWDTHNLKNISEVHGSSYFYGVGKKFHCDMLLSFFKMKALFWHQYQGINLFENLIVVPNLFMYISGRRSWVLKTRANPYELRCIITTFQISCKTVNKMWWYKLLFQIVFEQNIILYIKDKTKDVYCYLTFLEHGHQRLSDDKIPAFLSKKYILFQLFKVKKNVFPSL